MKIWAIVVFCIIAFSTIVNIIAVLTSKFPQTEIEGIRILDIIAEVIVLTWGASVIF